jgi:hypothetical protein
MNWHDVWLPVCCKLVSCLKAHSPMSVLYMYSNMSYAWISALHGQPKLQFVDGKLLHHPRQLQRAAATPGWILQQLSSCNVLLLPAVAGGTDGGWCRSQIWSEKNGASYGVVAVHHVALWSSTATEQNMCIVFCWRVPRLTMAAWWVLARLQTWNGGQVALQVSAR